MANTLLTVGAITYEAARVLHQKCNFIGSVDRQYDPSFSLTGAKIGDQLRVRMPNQYVVRSGTTFVPQDTVNTVVNLNVNNRKGVDMNFTTQDLSRSLDDFSKNIIEPAASVLASSIEAEFAQAMINATWNSVGSTSAEITWRNVLECRKLLSDNLAPSDNRALILATQHNLEVVDALKGLFQDSNEIASQYREGMIGRTAGFNPIYENTLLPSFTAGARNTAYVTSAIGVQGATTLPIITGAGNIVVGDTFTLTGVFAVHPETKATLPNLQKFVVTAALAGPGTLSFQPPLYASATGQKNISALPATGAALTFTGAANVSYLQSIGFQKGAYTFATADLILPEGVDFAARKVVDGISCRVVRQYAIADDTMPCRLDILYGYAALRPQLACRINGI